MRGRKPVSVARSELPLEKLSACPILPEVGEDVVDIAVEVALLPLPEMSKNVLVVQLIVLPSRGQ